LEHEPDSGKTYDPGKSSPISVASHGVSLSVAWEGIAWPAGHCVAETQNGRFCPWVLLASTQGMPELHHAYKSSGVVAGKAQRQRGT
jgi:hypothetical protein